ncbi:hypothetical protein ARALYDRAFT_480045 [Arabidopsis lyrata subsp. lyrata]|uniref:Protein kinase domain-containing protein n=1 Tax=Arabidopsis lyrata subsp. lyrata TaxID=81972 RepID=D7L6W7_ARALL|nr:hypothetical protein ARALYDRAFT_480045 [Arabidopsis lyrata subsp. lyrata]
MKKIFITLLWLLFISSFLCSSSSAEDDVLCLQGLKNSLIDPLSRLSSWSFPNSSASSICKLTGVSCWNEKENRIISLQLQSMQLAGEIPESLKLCRRMWPNLTQKLAQELRIATSFIYYPKILIPSNVGHSNRPPRDVGGKRSNGKQPKPNISEIQQDMPLIWIPSQICSWLPYLVTLDLSGNKLGGSIPTQIVESFCFDVFLLLGMISPVRFLPSWRGGFGGDDFSGNNGLCGKPLSRCGALNGRNLSIIIAAGVIGVVGSLCVGLVIFWWFFIREGSRKKKGYGAGKSKDDSDWIGLLRSHKLVQVTLFQKPIVKIKLGDLMAATNNFSSGNIDVSSRTGVSYKADLPDGSALAVKRLSACGFGEKQFRSEMNRLGELRHPNFGAAFSICLMARCFLSCTMVDCVMLLDWPTRLAIGVGAAKGLAWLHHGCQLPYLHQFISSNVILLDDDFDARITDYGLTRLVGSRDSSDSSFNNGDLGELGYVAPEYSSTMVASLKGDVYGFGIVLLEFVTGQKPLSVINGVEGFKGSLVDWVSQYLGTGRSKDAIDRSICVKGHDEEILQFLKIACSCVVSRPKERPTMIQVYEYLKNMADKHGVSEHYDEFPLVFNKQEP